jgi:hypothetical protein
MLLRGTSASSMARRGRCRFLQAIPSLPAVSQRASRTARTRGVTGITHGAPKPFCLALPATRRCAHSPKSNHSGKAGSTLPGACLYRPIRARFLRLFNSRHLTSYSSMAFKIAHFPICGVYRDLLESTHFPKIIKSCLGKLISTLPDHSIYRAG